jgi:hypothetical protein
LCNGVNKWAVWSDGRVELTFQPPAAHIFDLYLTCDGFASRSHGLNTVLPGARIELGDYVLPRAAVVVGQIVDADGGLLIEGWKVTALPVQFDRSLGITSFSSTSVTVDPESGSFRLENLLPCEYSIVARHGRTLETKPVHVPTLAGQTSEVELLYAGTAPSAMLQVIVQFDGPQSAGPAEGSLCAIARDGARVALH